MFYAVPARHKIRPGHIDSKVQKLFFYKRRKNCDQIETKI